MVDRLIYPDMIGIKYELLDFGTNQPYLSSNKDLYAGTLAVGDSV